ncbi:TRAP transporter substrate-binding protein [Chromohalobacter sp. HP20-39]|uniref:TRAP transporter substrate-binding protein n=1 Tax=Chromohalobacter sp. HP20-39 TaxID=3079306 RepID=UPI00294AD3EB|nr:TRAP transporter substrate-binding protein [Chromohalobacter sp. HP20-39]MDV6319777.1 TRAP transporter substrate-binding protein [Chromohalobacter sp. HP20-39]
MFTRIGMGVATAALALGLSTTASAETLRYAHVGAEGDLQTRYAAEAAKEINDATDGNISVQVFPASQLGGVAEMVDGVRMGSIGMGHHDFASLARIVPEAAVFNAPYVYRDAEHALNATAPESPAVQKINQQLIEEGGVRIIGRIYRGKRHISSNFAVKSPEDLDNKPFRAVPLDLWVSMVKGFGATPTPVAVSELPTALMTGLVVGQENPLTMINANQLYEVQSHVSLTGHMDSVLAVFVNEQAWQSLDESDRSAIKKVLDEKAEQSLQWAESSEDELVQTLTDKGMTVLDEDDGLDVEAFREQVRAQVDQDFPNFKPYIDMISKVE